MKISDSSILFLSDRSFLAKHTKIENLTVWGAGEEPLLRTDTNGLGRQIDVQKHIALLSKSTTVAFSEKIVRNRPVKAVAEPIPADQELMADLNIRILKAMVERLTGKQIQIHTPNQVQDTATKPVSATIEHPESEREAPSAGGLVYDYYESHYEYESTNFSSSGKIITEDGMEIDFTVSLQMSREFFTEEQLTIRAGDALKDPLVINFSGKAAELSERKFSFDIDMDGRENQISFLQPGSGFLALDKNNDQTINNGSELFGPESGNGFKDLAAYDLDENNWIDENDAIYDNLRIWVKDADGNDSLFALGEKGIGAIYLNSAATLFSLKDSDNTLQGQVQSTSLFVRQDGGVGTVQQVDLVA